MTNLLEFNARAELCRKLAKLEPRASCIWLAEADRWSRLTHESALINEYELSDRPLTESHQHSNEPSA
jgi:hypothetical protein